MQQTAPWYTYLCASHQIIPPIGLATAYLLASAITGHAPRVARVLSTSCLRPLAVLSYSMYLLQYVAMQLMPHIYDYLELPVRARGRYDEI